MKLLTVAAVTDKFKINGGLARRFMRSLAAEGKIKAASDLHSK